jgi:hypothetical protein
MSFKSQLLESLDHEDDLGMVIRAHIVIEQYLNTIIESYITDFETYKKVKLTYEQTYLLVISLGLASRFKKPLSAIGSIRNAFAHRLRSPCITKEDANTIYKELGQDEKDTLQKEYKKIAKGFDEKPFNQISPRQKFMYCVVILGSALEVVCNQLPNKKINKDT